MPNKDEVARLLANAHRDAEPAIVRIIRLVSSHEAEAREPVKLLEVNPATSPSGIFPIAFGAAPPAVPYPSIVVEVTPDEFRRVERGELALPHDWRLGPTLYGGEAPAHAEAR